MRRFPINQPKSKYRNEKVTFQGMSFDSKKELQRYLFLLDAERRGVISDLQRQVKFELIPAITEEYVEHLKTKDKVKTRTVQFAINYCCDFTYKNGDTLVVEDVKSSPNTAALDDTFLIKEKLFFWKYGYRIRRVYKPTEPI